MKNEKVWYEEINQVRGFAIIVLLLYHAGFLRDGLLGGLEYWNLFAVPIFFFISGLVLTLRYKDGLNVKLFYKKRFRYLIPAYFFWSIITVSLVRGVSLQSLVDILTGDSPGIWFLFVLFELYLIFPILLKICKRKYGIWLFGIILSFVLISTILLWNYLFNMLFHRFYFNLIVYKSELIILNISKFFWFIPFSIYFIFGILIGYDYEQFKKTLMKYKNAILIIWISLLITIPIIIHSFNLIYTGYFNFIGILFGLSSIFFFFWIFSQKDSKFFNINGNIAVAIFLTSPLILTLLLRFYYSAGLLLINVGFYLGVLFFGLSAILFFILAYKLWGSKFFYFKKKLALAFFLVPTVIFTILFGFLSIPWDSNFDFFILSTSSFFLAYLICLSLIALIKKIPHYQYLLTEIKD